MKRYEGEEASHVEGSCGARLIGIVDKLEVCPDGFGLLFTLYWWLNWTVMHEPGSFNTIKGRTGSQGIPKTNVTPTRVRLRFTISPKAYEKNQQERAGRETKGEEKDSKKEPYLYFQRKRFNVNDITMHSCMKGLKTGLLYRVKSHPSWNIWAEYSRTFASVLDATNNTDHLVIG